MQRDSTAPRPRPCCRRPKYPRCVGVALLVIASAGCDKPTAEPPLEQPPGIEAIPFDAAPAGSIATPPPASATPPPASATAEPTASAPSTRPDKTIPTPPPHPMGVAPAPFDAGSK